MKYSNIKKAEFIARPNRFVAIVRTERGEETVHVKNTGRCRELLVPGVAVYLNRPGGEKRKTEYDLVAVEKQREGMAPLLINMDSQLPNAVAAEWIRGNLLSPNARIKREVFYGDSRFDIYFEDGDRRGFAEVKGVTLEEDGVARFPDAPTERGIKHLKGLARAVEEGYDAYVIFIVQMEGMKRFEPNDATHPQFGEALRRAAEKGVKVVAAECEVRPDSVVAQNRIPVVL